MEKKISVVFPIIVFVILAFIVLEYGVHIPNAFDYNDDGKIAAVNACPSVIADPINRPMTFLFWNFPNTLRGKPLGNGCDVFSPF